MTSALQSAKSVLMVRPAVFGYNPETAQTNHYQHKNDQDLETIYQSALREFDDLHATLIRHGIKTYIFENTDQSAPDAIFPNATSSHQNGVALYPLLQPSRQRERSPAFVSYLQNDLGQNIIHDFSAYEAEGRALEATASLVMDRVNKIAYCAVSARSDVALAHEAANALGYELITFETQDHTGAPVYHTDVVMYIGSGYVGICLDSITKGREKVEQSLSGTHHVIPLTADQMLHMCGNALEIMDSAGKKKYLVMSSKAHQHYSDTQKDTINSHVDDIIHADLSNIEKYGGGSARCMLLDLHFANAD